MFWQNEGNSYQNESKECNSKPSLKNKYYAILGYNYPENAG
jgi:hypothetical protein